MKDPEKIVRNAAQMIDPRSNYRKAIEQVLEGHAKGMAFSELAHQAEDRWRAEYPQMNNAVANGALVAIGVLYGGGDFLRSMNVVTQLADFADADCNAANVGSILGAMHGIRAIPENLKAQFHDRIWGESMGPVTFKRVVDEKISDLAGRIAAFGRKNLLVNGATLSTTSGGEESFRIPNEAPRTQALEYFDINDYGPLWNPAWKLDGAGRGGAGTFLDGDVLVTVPRDTRPCRLETDITVPQGLPRLRIDVKADSGKPWRLETFVDDEQAGQEVIGSGDWRTLSVDLSRAAGKRVKVRLYQQSIDFERRSGYWRNPRVE